ncbi:MAG: hypothetical protein ABI954_01920 [Pyrinomonadaceae bacterium]
MSLINPNFPRSAAGLRRESVSVISLQKQGRRFGLRRAATIQLPEGVLQPDFFEENIVEPSQVLSAMREAATSAGLNGQKKWSVSLPADTARMTILTLETAPKSKAERADVLNWKAERAFGEKPAEMRLAFQPLTPDEKGRTRFFAMSIRLDVLAEYEDLFDTLGWKTGLMLPRHISEANWLMLPKSTGDAMMVSLQADGFTAVLLRASQPAVVRSVICEPEEREDELYRLLLFYRDRFETETSGASLQKLLLIGADFPKERLSEIAQETLGYDLQILGSNEVGLSLPAEIRFEDIAAPAGLASLAWR